MNFGTLLEHQTLAILVPHEHPTPSILKLADATQSVHRSASALLSRTPCSRDDADGYEFLVPMNNCPFSKQVTTRAMVKHGLLFLPKLYDPALSLKEQI